MTCVFMQLETKLQKSIRIGVTIFKISIYGGISSDILSEITFYGDGGFGPYIQRFTSPNENLEKNSYPLNCPMYIMKGHSL